MATPTSTVSIPGAATIKPYASGLNGVNVPLDNTASHALYTTLAILFLIVLGVRLAHMTNAHLRHLTSMGSLLEQDAYWSQERRTFWPALKHHLLYAPLKNKRHNKEFQLSKAVNVGTLPSRFQTILLVGYLISNIIYCMLLDYTASDNAAIIAEIRGRTGHLSVVNTVFLFLFAGRNNPLIMILGVPFDTFNLFHRWIGRIVVLEAIVHTIAWSINERGASGTAGVNHALQTVPFLQYGLAGTIAMSLILIQAPSVVRHAAYETFLHLHQVLAAVALVSIYFHAKLGELPQMPYIIGIICIWFYDRIFRWARLLYQNVSYSNGLTRASVEALPGDACRVTFFLPRPWAFTPGTHAYIYLPSVSFWMSHPFSIAWSNQTFPSGLSRSEEKLPIINPDLIRNQQLSLPSRPTTSISFLLAKRSGMTAKLYDRAASAPQGILHLNGLLEGPYGNPSSLHSYGTVMLFAGGVGITHQLPHVRALLAAHALGTTAVRKIHLIWIVRYAEQLDWVRPWMNEILDMSGRREVLTISMFVTKADDMMQITSGSAKVKIFPGRPTLKLILRNEWNARCGAMVVGVCGPGALSDDVREAVRGCEKGGVVDFWEEAFTW